MRQALCWFGIAASACAIGACGGEREEVKTEETTSGGEAFAAPKEPSLAAGNGQSCGLRSGGALYCWGKNAEQAPKGSYHRVSVGFDHGCAIRAEQPRQGELDCWGRDDVGQATPPEGKYIEVAAGYAHTCALKPNGQAECFGRGAAKPPADKRFRALSAGKGFSCGITEDSVECWGEGGSEQTEGAIGRFAMLSSGPHYSCALNEDGTLDCWGLDKNAKGLKVPEGRFRAIAVGLESACGLLRDGNVLCFGSDANAQHTAPDGTFFAIASGWVHTCGIRQEGDVECWGSDFNGESQPHEQFSKVTVPGGRSSKREPLPEEEPAAAAESEEKPARAEPASKGDRASAAKAGKQQPAAAGGGDSDMTFDLEEASQPAEPAKPKTKAEEARERRQKEKDFDSFLK